MQHRAPLFEALTAHAGKRARAFHVPGHKQRASFGLADAKPYYEDLLRLDLTELSDTDDLHHAQGCLQEAQELAAECFGAEETKFLVGGSTAGNLAMILGICAPGDLVIVQRNVHKSIIHALMLAGARAVLLQPETDPVSGLGLLPSQDQIKLALKRYPEAKGILFTNPNYYGMTADLVPLVRIAHEQGIPVLVDEAHGPHFGFHPRFPKSALQAGADIVVHSAHKMLSAMTMGAMLHMQGGRLKRESIRQALRMVQSSSPSYPIMASLDLARHQLHTDGPNAFEHALSAVDRIVDGIQKTRFRMLGMREYRNADVAYDPLKMVLFDSTGKLSGFELRDALEQRGCIAEMADVRYVVFALGTGSISEDGEALAEALMELTRSSNRGKGSSPLQAFALPETDVPEPVAFHRHVLSSEPVALEDCVGRVAAEWMIPYPPGIPVLFPGEVIRADVIDRLKEWRMQGAHIQGPEDETLRFVRVAQKVDR